MRLLNVETFKLESFVSSDEVKYAILSHNWDNEEITSEDMTTSDEETVRQKLGWSKVLNACQIVLRRRLRYIWIDTCCTIQTHHRRQCPTKRVAYAAESGGRMYIGFQYKSSSISFYLLTFLSENSCSIL